jgi:predicted nucleic acid-binding protein
VRFVDTNILVYAEQPGAEAKHEAACRLLRDLWDRRDGALSAQVLQEFFVNVTRKMPSPYSAEVAQRIIANYLAWTVVPIDGQLVLDAVDIQRECQLSYWDAAIVAAAATAGATELLTEDLNDGQVIRGVRVVNPLPR